MTRGIASRVWLTQAHDAVFKMQLDDVLIQSSGVFKHDGAHWGVLAPLPQFLVRAARHAKRIECARPCWIGSSAAI
jgi:hypothetical protein